MKKNIITIFDNKFELSIKTNADYETVRHIIYRFLNKNNDFYFLPNLEKQKAIVKLLKDSGYKVKILKQVTFENFIDIGIFKIDSDGNIHNVTEDLDYE